MDIIYGCECKCGVHERIDAETAPVAYLVEREGRTLKVCTRCDLSSDTRVARLFDRSTHSDSFMEYDPLGAMAMLGQLDSEKEEEFAS